MPWLSNLGAYPWLKDPSFPVPGGEDRPAPPVAPDKAPLDSRGATASATSASKEREALQKLSQPVDIDQMSPDEAKARFDQLTALKRIGDTQGMWANAVFGGEATDSIDTYIAWLGERGKTATPGGLALNLSLIDLKA